MTNLKFWVPLLTTLFSAGATVTVGHWLIGDQSSATARAAYEALDDRDQQRVRNHAENLVDRPEELKRLSAIHEVVIAAPELKNQLKQIQAFVSELDSESRNRLLPNGEFADDWMQQIQAGLNSDPRSERIVVIRLVWDLELKLSEERIAEFVDEMLQNESAAELARLHGYDNQVAVTFAKLLHLCGEIFGRRAGSAGELDLLEGTRTLYASLNDRLFNETDDDVLQRYAELASRNTVGRTFFEDWHEVSIAWRFLHHTLEYYANALKREYQQPSEQMKLEVFGTLPRDQQLTMMSKTPAEIRDELNSAALRHNCPEDIRQLLLDYDHQQNTTRMMIYEWQRKRVTQGGKRRNERRFPESNQRGPRRQDPLAPRRGLRSSNSSRQQP